MLTQFKIKPLILSSVLAMAAISTVLSLTSLYSIDQLGDQLNQATENIVPSQTMLGDMQAGVAQIQALLGGQLLARSDASAREHDRAISERIVAVEKQINAYRAMVVDAEEAGLYAAVRRDWAGWKATLPPIRAAGLRLDTERGRELYNGAQRDASDRINAALNAELAYNLRYADSVSDQGSKMISRATLMAECLAVFAGLLAGGVYWLMRRRVTKPIEDLTSAMKRMAGGELDLAIPGAALTDELGDMARALSGIKINVEERTRVAAERQMAVQSQIVTAIGTGLGEIKQGNLAHRIIEPFPPEFEVLRSDFNAALGTIADLMLRVAEAAESVRTGATEISSASDDLARRTESQAASLEQTAAAMDQFTGTARETAQSAGDVSQAVASAQGDAVSGGEVVRQAVDAMGSIEKSSQEMAAIVSMIDSLSFQTNLLALNAGVEAARAGEAGNGFAVVANEVRALAQRCADAAREINALIATSSRQVESGVQLVNRTGEMLDRIVARVGEVSSAIAQIATSAQEQAGTVQQVNTSVSEMDRMTQQNAALVEQSTAAARSLANEADHLTSLVSQFSLGAERPHAAPVQAPAPRRIMTARHGNLALAPHDDAWNDL